MERSLQKVCGGLYAADFKILFVKVDLFTIRYLAQIISGVQLEHILRLDKQKTVNKAFCLDTEYHR